MPKFRVAFGCSFDNDQHEFRNKKEAIVIAQSLTDNEVGGFDWYDEGEYKYLLFNEYLVADVESVYDLEDYDFHPKVEGAEYRYHRRIKASN